MTCPLVIENSDTIIRYQCVRKPPSEGDSPAGIPAAVSLPANWDDAHPDGIARIRTALDDLLGPYTASAPVVLADPEARLNGGHIVAFRLFGRTMVARVEHWPKVGDLARQWNTAMGSGPGYSPIFLSAEAWFGLHPDIQSNILSQNAGDFGLLLYLPSEDIRLNMVTIADEAEAMDQVSVLALYKDLVIGATNLPAFLAAPKSASNATIAAMEMGALQTFPHVVAVGRVSPTRSPMIAAGPFFGFGGTSLNRHGLQRVAAMADGFQYPSGRVAQSPKTQTVSAPTGLPASSGSPAARKMAGLAWWEALVAAVAGVFGRGSSAVSIGSRTPLPQHTPRPRTPGEGTPPPAGPVRRPSGPRHADTARTEPEPMDSSRPPSGTRPAATPGSPPTGTRLARTTVPPKPRTPRVTASGAAAEMSLRVARKISEIDDCLPGEGKSADFVIVRCQDGTIEVRFVEGENPAGLVLVGETRLFGGIVSAGKGGMVKAMAVTYKMSE